MLVEILTPDFTFDDERGNITQLVHEGYKQVNVVFSKKGARRGNFHYHKLNEEAFFVVSGKIKLKLALDGAEEEHEFSTGDMFLVKKFVRHSFDFLEDTTLVGMYDRGVELADGLKDIYED